MELSKEDTARIESYLEGTLSEGEKIALQKRMAQNPAFEQEVRYMAGESELMRAGRRREIMQQLGQVENRLQANRLNRRRFMAIAASLVLLALPLYFFLLPGTPSGPDICDQYFEPYLLGGPQRDNSPPTPYDEAWESYKNGDYKAAIPYFSSVSPADSNYPNIQLYLGISYIGDDQTEAAMAQLKTISEAEDHPFEEEALFFLGLTQLHQNQMDAALKTYTKLQDQGGQYRSEDVKSIIKTIN